jgi:hypothetical protein
MEFNKKLDDPSAKARKLLQFLSGVIALSGFINFLLLLLIPSDQKNVLIAGFSLKRFSVLLFLLAGTISSIFAFIIFSKASPDKIKKISDTIQGRWISTLIFGLFFITILFVWATGFSPEYFLNGYFEIGKRLLPIFQWLLTILVCAIGFIFFLKFNEIKIKFVENTKYWPLLVVTIPATFLLFLAIAWIYPQLTAQLWFGRFFVPILMTQIMGAWIVLALGLLIPFDFRKEIPSFFTKHADLLIFLLIWAAAAFFWVNQPVKFSQGMFSTAIEQHIKPFPPNFEIYPRKDSLTYYNVSQSIVTGGGIYRSIDKSLFLSFEGFNNWLAKGSFEKMLNNQTILLALFPAVLYLLGRKMHSRPAGFLAAALAIMQEMNGIQLMSDFPVISSKVLLSEPFMQLWTGIITLIGFMAFKANKKFQTILLIIFGGTLGLSALFRLNTIVVIPFIVILAFLYYFRDKKRMAWFIGIFLAGIIISLTPWVIYNAIKFHNPIAFINSKVGGVIIDNRYEKINTQASPADNRSEAVLPDLLGSTGDPISSVTVENRLLFINTSKMEITFAGFNNLFPSKFLIDGLSDISKIAKSVFRHFLNNIISSFSILPTSITPQDLFHGARVQKFWGTYDAASYEGINPFLVGINLIILAIGISSAIKNHQIIGILPIAVFLGYHLSNGLAISSGNRYTQPVSWVIYFYFAIGLVAITKYFIDLGRVNKRITPITAEESKQKNKMAGLLIALLLILAIGCAPLAANLLPVDRYPKSTSDNLLLAIEKNASNKGVSDSIERFLGSFRPEEINLTYGRILMPILVDSEEFRLSYGRADYGGDAKYLTFMLLAPGTGNIKRIIFYPQSDSVLIPNNTDVILFSRKDLVNEAIGIALVDPAFASGISTYESILNIPLSNFYISKNVLNIQ